MLVHLFLLLNFVNFKSASSASISYDVHEPYRLAKEIQKEIRNLHLPAIRTHEFNKTISLTSLDPNLAKVVLEDTSKIAFRLFTRKNPNFSQKLILGESRILKSSHFNVGKPVKIYIHGWLTISKYAFGLSIMKSYLQETDVNVILVDWRQISGVKSYPWVVVQTKAIGNQIGKFLNFLVQSKVDVNRIHIIGHGLGAHIAAFASEAMTKIPGRITALDPALPGFDSGLLSQIGGNSSGLGPNNAHFVDVIHTNGGMLGFMDANGFVDFYPNGGKKQVGCGTDILCSHERSVYYFDESIGREIFPAKLCKSGAFDALRVLMGNPAPFSAKGLFCLKTKGTAPFGLRKNELGRSLNQQLPKYVLRKSASSALVKPFSFRTILFIGLCWLMLS